MPSPTLKEIIGEMRFALTTRLKQQYPDQNGGRGFLQTTEAYFIRTMYGIDPKDRIADYYIAPGDGAGPIVVEIGDKPEAIWETLISTDGQPVRVLHIGFDRALHLQHPRHTQFEGDLLDVLGLAL